MLRIRNLEIEECEIPKLVRVHRCHYPDTPNVEKEAEALAEGAFDENASKHFVRSVCRWGRFAGIAGRVVRRNDGAAISTALRNAHRCAATGRVVEGLAAINNLNGLGRPSFASKHLRFLVPRSAVVLDSVISGRLGYPLSLDGYAALLSDCANLTARVNEAGIDHPYRSGESWYISDIELALFVKLRGF